MEAIKNDRHELIMNGILKARVCSSGTWDEALEWIRQENPAGTQNNWSKDESINCRPVTCSDDPGRKHFMFVC